MVESAPHYSFPGTGDSVVRAGPPTSFGGMGSPGFPGDLAQARASHESEKDGLQKIVAAGPVVGDEGLKTEVPVAVLKLALLNSAGAPVSLVGDFFDETPEGRTGRDSQSGFGQ